MGMAAQAGSAAPHLCHTHEGLPRASDGGMVTGKKAERTKNDGQEREGRGKQELQVSTHICRNSPGTVVLPPTWAAAPL